MLPSIANIDLIKKGSDFEQECSDELQEITGRIRLIIFSALRNLPSEEIPHLQQVIFDISEALVEEE